jgi:acyl-CoA synthetase (NDP forming)
MPHVRAPSSLNLLFKPRSVAILGASSDPNRISGRPLRYLLEGKYSGGIYPVNPKRDEVQGVKAYPTLASLPEVPDVVIMAVPASITLQAVEDCIALGVPAAVIFSAGYAESDKDGAALQEQITVRARAGGRRLVGPNCLGVFNSEIGFFGTFTQSLDRDKPGPGPVGIISQSGAYGSHIAYLARKRGIGVRYWITTGNEADVDVAESLEWMATQSDIAVIMVYVEGVRDGARFRAALDLARRNRKPVIMMKVGRSEVGARAASSHTASLAGEDAIYDGLFAQYGVYRATTTEEQLDVTYACARGIFPKGNKLGVVTLSGGAGVVISDAAERHGLDVAPMPMSAQKVLKELLPFATVGNPVDTTAQALNDMSLLSRNMDVILDQGGYDMLIGFFSTLPTTRTLAGPLKTAISEGCARFPDRLVAMAMIGDEETVREYEASGFLVFEDAERAVQALAALTQISAAFDATPAPTPTALKAPPLAAAALSERAAKALLAAARLPFLEEHLAIDAGAAVQAANEVGLPVVLKIVSPDIAHKTEIGGVIVGLNTSAEVAQGFAELTDRAARLRPDAHIEGILVAPLAGDGVEIIAGTSRDPVFGPAVMFGLGGVHVEVLRDVTFRLAPFDFAEAKAMINQIRGRALLDGVRGEPPSDVDALAKMLVQLAAFADVHSEDIQNIDLNPVLVRTHGQGVVALDALVEPSNQKEA